jgi:hypothetical protein
MKRTPWLALLALALSAHAEDVLYMGRWYKNPQIVGVAPGNKVVIGFEGLAAATVPLYALSASYRQEHQEEYDQALKKAGEIQLATDPNGAAKIAERALTIKAVESDIAARKGRAIWVSGKLDVSSDYYGAYYDTKLTHSAFRITDGTSVAYVYMPRETGMALTQKINASGPIKGSFLIEFSSKYFNKDLSSIFADLIAIRQKELAK